MAVKQFKAESKRLLDLMINSIYTHKEIFLRELISNASDAIDKLYFLSLTDDSVKTKKKDYVIRLAADKQARTITVEDNGIGMTKEELEKNLGTIAKSGSFDFKQENAENKKVDIIGQFGVGFYSAFMVADEVTVETRAFGDEQAWRWHSKGAEGYTVTPCDKQSVGTRITLQVKPAAEDENYDEFLEPYRLQAIVKKYSDYIRYPIKMLTEKRVKKEGAENEYETVQEDTTLNSMVPIWKRDRKKVTDEEYAAFYAEKFYDYTAPRRILQSKTEGTATFTSLLFIPGKAPYNYYSKEYEKGLQLYASGVLIMEKCADLLPDYFSFVRGLVDSQDLSLNISREMLQHDNQLKLIRNTLERKIKNELTAMLNNEREEYDKFFADFGLQLKMGCYADYGMHKEQLQDLLEFYSAKQQKPVTLREYCDSLTDGQKYIYYATGETVDRIAKLPQAERVLDKGCDVLYLTDDADEFVLTMMHAYDEKEFKNVASSDLGLESEEEQKAAQEKAEENKDLFDAMQKALDGKVKAVTLSSRLKTHPVCLTTSGALSIEMEKVLNNMPNQDKVSSEKVLEINGEHPIFNTLQTLHNAGDSATLADYAELLYDQALLIEGLPIDDPVAYANKVCALMK